MVVAGRSSRSGKVPIMLKTAHATALTLLVLAMQSPTAQALPNSFIQFSDGASTTSFLKGESVALGHEDWSEVDAWSWLVSAESSFIKGGGASVGKPQPGPFRWQQDLDRTYPKLFTFLVQGKHSAKVKFDVTTNTGGSKPEVFFNMEFGEVFYTRLATSGSSGGPLQLNGEFVFKEVSMSYKPMDSKGKLGPAVTAKWNVATNVAGGQSFYEFSGDPMALEGLSQAMALSVPEPQTWLMMLGGLAALGGLAQRRRGRASH